jgi:hypothetical protein
MQSVSWDFEGDVRMVNPLSVIAGLDPAIPIRWHGCALLSGMAGSSPAMTVQQKQIMLRLSGL